VELAKLKGEQERNVQRVDHELLLAEKQSEKEMASAANDAKLAELVERHRGEQAMLSQANDAALGTKKQDVAHELKILDLQSQKLLEAERVALLELIDANTQKEASSAGAVTGIKLGSGVHHYLTTLASEMPRLDERIALYKLLQEYQSRNQTTSNLASGRAQLYVTPDNLNLRIDSLHNRSEL